MRLCEIRDAVRDRLRKAGIEDFEYETWLLLEWKLGVTRADYYVDSGRAVDAGAQEALFAAVRRREERIPLQYLMGTCEFMGYPFFVDEHTLIPRADTECLVETALAWIRNRREAGREPVRILDLCCGSGCIGLSVKKLLPETEVALSDCSEGALCAAKKNAAALSAAVEFFQGDLFENVRGRYDAILSNPPYIPTREIEGLMPEVRDHEPHLALDGGEDGLTFYRRILREAKDYLKPGGAVFFEIGCEQGGALFDIFKENGYENTAVGKDLAGLDRVASGSLPER